MAWEDPPLGAAAAGDEANPPWDHPPATPVKITARYVLPSIWNQYNTGISSWILLSGWLGRFVDLDMDIISQPVTSLCFLFFSCCLASFFCLQWQFYTYFY